MGLNYSILANKPKIKLPDNNGNLVECIDLLPDTISHTSINPHCQKCIVNEHYVARPDLISLAFYGTDEYADIICKINGISNPFELNEDDMLSIPLLEDILDYNKVNKNRSELITNSSTIARSSTSNQKELNKKRSSNEQIVGDKNYVIDKSLGLIFY